MDYKAYSFEEKIVKLNDCSHKYNELVFILNSDFDDGSDT